MARHELAQTQIGFFQALGRFYNEQTGTSSGDSWTVLAPTRPLFLQTGM